jgi:hypothetical protein
MENAIASVLLECLKCLDQVRLLGLLFDLMPELEFFKVQIHE